MATGDGETRDLQKCKTLSLEILQRKRLQARGMAVMVPRGTAIPASDAASSSAENPQSNSDLTILSTASLTTANIIPSAHKSPLSIVLISQNGSLLATASVNGTVIRVWSVLKADKLYNFRLRSRGARIYTIAFNPSSANKTVHVFKLRRSAEESKAPTETTSVSETGSIERRDGPLEGG